MLVDNYHYNYCVVLNCKSEVLFLRQKITVCFCYQEVLVYHN